MGNLESVKKALKKIGCDFLVSHKSEDIIKATHLILPGVGHFQKGMDNIKELGLDKVLYNEVIIKKKPLLGVCLGMQLLFSSSEEGGFLKGLGYIEGQVKLLKFQDKNIKVPHVGWNTIDFENNPLDIFKGIESDTDFYFVHSYCVQDYYKNIYGNYGETHYGINFLSSVQISNIFGVQFHPEKSQKSGLKILKNFAEWSSKSA